MSNPHEAVIPGYARYSEACGIWAQIKDNDKLSVVGVNINLGLMHPAEKNVCWIIIPTKSLP